MIYFDNAATTWPKPSRVVNEMIKCMDKYAANPGRSGHSMSVYASEKVYECRECISDFFGLNKAENVIFTMNATHSLNIVINGILQKGDHVICTVMDHNSVLRPIVSKKESIEFSFISADSCGKICAEEVKSKIKSNTKLIVMTHVSNVCGTIMEIDDVLAICKENGILFMLDASQSAGILPVNICEMGIDYLAAPGHKGLYGPMGTGILCLNSDVVPLPLMYGGTGSYSRLLSQPEELPDRFESGTLNLPGIVGLCEGINFVKSIGVDQIRKHENKLTSFLLDGLSEISGIKIVGNTDLSGRCGVVSFVHSTHDSVHVATELNKSYNIAVRSMYHCAYPAHQALGTSESGTVRVSFGIFNTIPQVKMLLYALSHM